MGIGLAIKTSRPRFWLYLAGPFLVGAIWSTTPVGGLSSVQKILQDPTFIVGLLYFLLPANILLYGINDLSDKDIDKNSAKKLGKENTNIKGRGEKMVKVWIAFSLLASLLFLLYLSLNSQLLSAIWLTVFLTLSVLYSLWPIRLKTKPFLDFASNFLYIIPGIISFILFSNSKIPWQILLSATFWVWAMHLFSAIPDIETDDNQGVKTTAVFLGRELSLLICLLFWSISLLVISISGASLAMILLGFLYPFIPLHLLIGSKSDDISAYWKFPYLNAVYGFLIFLTGLVRYI